MTRRILLDLPYAVPFITAEQLAVARPQWGNQYGLWIQRIGQGTTVPRLADLQGLRERALWQLLLYDTVLMPMTTLQTLKTVATGLSGPLSPELQKLASLDFVEAIETPPQKATGVPLTESFIRGLQPVIVADLVGDGRYIAPFEFEFAARIIGTQEYEQLKEQEGKLYDLCLPPLVHMRKVPRGSTWEELKLKVQEMSVGPLSFDAGTGQQLEEKVCALVREALAPRFAEGRLKEASKETILRLYGRTREIEDSADRLQRILLTAAATDADVKLDVAPSPDTEQTPGSRVQGEHVQQVVNVFLDVTQFPRVETVDDVVRHRGEPYIEEMRKAIRDWASAVAVGNLREEAALRLKIRERVNEAGRKVRRWRVCRMTLGAVAWAGKRIGAGAVVGSLAGAAIPGIEVAAAAGGVIGFGADLGGRLARWREKRRIRKDGWLLHGRET